MAANQSPPVLDSATDTATPTHAQPARGIQRLKVINQSIAKQVVTIKHADRIHDECMGPTRVCRRLLQMHECKSNDADLTFEGRDGDGEQAGACGKVASHTQQQSHARVAEGQCGECDKRYLGGRALGDTGDYRSDGFALCSTWAPSQQPRTIVRETVPALASRRRTHTPRSTTTEISTRRCFWISSRWCRMGLSEVLPGETVATCSRRLRPRAAPTPKKARPRLSPGRLWLDGKTTVQY